jgi:hypothetical protein
MLIQCGRDGDAMFQASLPFRVFRIARDKHRLCRISRWGCVQFINHRIQIGFEFARTG